MTRLLTWNPRELLMVKVNNSDLARPVIPKDVTQYMANSCAYFDRPQIQDTWLWFSFLPPFPWSGMLDWEGGNIQKWASLDCRSLRLSTLVITVVKDAGSGSGGAFTCTLTLIHKRGMKSNMNLVHGFAHCAYRCLPEMLVSMIAAAIDV